jgi:DNA helicase IV
MHFVVDEGQDLPQGFYESIMALGHENFFIVADQNQQITDDHSNIQELTDMLGLNRSDVIELRENFRNTKEIAVLSQHFYADKASAKPELPKSLTQEIPVLYEYEMVDNCVKMMLREADRDPSSLIGLIVATETKREDYVRRLRKMDIDRDYERPLVSSYAANDKGKVEIDFSQGGIVVITDKSSKGIEFDTVFIILDGLKLSQGDSNAMKKRLYVMTSRARKKLVLFKGMSCDQAVSDLLPEDENILKRITL